VLVVTERASAEVPTNNYFPIAGYTRSSAGCSNNFSMGGHEGTDCFAPHGTPLIAVESGRIDYVRPQTSSFNCSTRTGSKSGNRFSLTGNSGSRYYYGHLSSFASGPSAGDTVAKGQVLGYLGETGNARCSAPHLHFQIWDRGTLVAPYSRMRYWTAANGRGGSSGSGGGGSTGGSGTTDARQPVGHLDHASVRDAGSIGFYGWTVDPDTPTRSIQVHVYITRSNGTRTGPIVLAANHTRSDVGAVHPNYGSNHGYEMVLDGLPRGSTKVEAYGIDSSGRSNDYSYLGGKWVSVT
jgi:hypothetical protein